MGILVCGLNGSGKSTVGKALADALSCRFIDSEDLFFPKNDPAKPYGCPRGRAEAVAVLEKMIAEDSRYVFASVRGDYGEVFAASVSCAVCVDVPRDVREKRLIARSQAKFGERVLYGGDLYESENRFLQSVMARPDDYVETWLAAQPFPTIHIDGTRPAAENVSSLAEHFFNRDF